MTHGTGKARRWGIPLALTLLFVLLSAAPALAQSGQRCFAETGQCVSGRIRQYWEHNGGLPVFGFPIGPQQEMTIEGKPIQAQWFERNRLELHPENAAPYDVLLGRLGVDVLAKQGRDWLSFPKANQDQNGDAEDCRWFEQTQHSVCGEFLQAYRMHGLDLGAPGNTESLALFGLPISQPMTETLEGKPYQVQWFERARFELHPELRSTVRILLGRLGAEFNGASGATPAPAPGMAIDKYAPYLLKPNSATPADGSVRLTWYGTTMFLIDDGETKLLFDAFITHPSQATVVRSLKTGEALIQTDPAAVDAWLARPEVGKPAALFVAHSHHDHAIDVAYVANKTGAHVYGSDSTLNIARGGDVPEAQLSRYQLMKPLTIGKFTVTVLPGRHELNPPPLPDDRYLIIKQSLRQPARFVDYVEGGSFSFLVQHGDHAILVGGASYVPGGYYGLRADVALLFAPWYDDPRRQDDWYASTVSEMQPHLVIPTHWDDLFTPVTDRQGFDSDKTDVAWSDLIRRLKADGRQFGYMQGYESILLFGKDGLGLQPNP